MSTLYTVGTPIGNLEDVTLRTLRVLKSVDVIACEDTRVTKKLLAKYEIRKPLFSYHAHSTKLHTQKIIDVLERGGDVALVSDAGTPGISDPGSKLVAYIRKNFPAVTVVAIPGANAAIAALSISGFPASDFLFLGFLPHKKGRETLFKEIVSSKRTVVFYESPHRIMKTLASLAGHLSSSRRIGVAREITKIHEEFVMGGSEEVLAYFTDLKERVRGEFVVLVSPEKD